MCNAIIPRASGRYTIEGQLGECSMHLIFPSDIIVRSVGLGSPGRVRLLTMIKTGSNYHGIENPDL